MAMASPAAGVGAPAPQRDSSALLELLSDWYWEQDAEFRFTVISRRNPDAVGPDPFPYVGRKHWEQPALNLTEEAWERHRAQLAWHQPYRDFELQHVTEDGRVVWVSLSGQPMFDDIGTFIGYRGIGRDVTAQKRAEQLLELEHGVARCLAQAASASEGLRTALRVICEIEGWDAGRCFRIQEGSGELKLAEGWFAREAGIEQLLRNSRVLWQSGKPVWSNNLPSPRPTSEASVKGARFATFAVPVLLQGRSIALLTFSGHTAREPDQSFVAAAPALGTLFGQFLQRCDAEDSLRESEARFRSLTQLSSDFFWESDAQHRLSSIVHGPGYAAAPVGYAALGKTPWEMPSSSPDETGWKVHKHMVETRLPFRDFEIARPLADGGTRHFAVSGEPRYDSHGAFLGYRGVGRDVTEIAAARERIASLAYSDPLTGLTNRVSLAPALEQAIERSRRHGWKIAGVFVDLDGFKQINDRHGHAAGDAFLVEVAQRLRRNVRASDLVARLGGDEFFLVLEEVQDMAAVESIVGKLIDALRRPYVGIGEAQRRISATLGVSIFPDDAPDATTLMEHADEAMYTAKQAGKNAYCLYSTQRKTEPNP
ncbi:MAG TPA: diguanylate cyclase [Burkholderiales bacterium]|nr:diguanylate cyclase [Burkholderiales bacterium]